MEIRLARANSLIDIGNGGHVEVVTGTPARITERVCMNPLHWTHPADLHSR
jgi:hypothetical protein